MIAKKAFSSKVKSKGINIELGPFSFNIQSSIPNVIDELYENYKFHEISDTSKFIDFYVSLERPRGIRRWIKPQVEFFFDGHSPFKPLPLAQSYPMLEWGMNWCIANYGHYYLIIHAAVVAKGNKAVLLPAPQGSGKSTLCAALVNSGWRLFSDELAIISLKDGIVFPCVRPVSLKNESIEIIKSRYPTARLMSPVHDTTKGTVSLMSPNVSSVQDGNNPAKIAAIVFPKYQAKIDGKFLAKDKSQTFIELIQNSFNYHVISKQSFDIGGDIVEAASCYEYTYSDLNKAIADFESLVN